MFVLSLIALPFFVSTLVLLNRFSRIVLSNYRESVGFFRDSISFELKGIENIAVQLQLFRKTTQLYSSDDTGDFSNAVLYNYIRSFQNAVSSLSLLSDLYIYYPETDFVVGHLGSYTARGYYFFMTGSFSDHEEWIEAIQEANFGYSVVSDPYREENRLILKRYIPWYTSDSREQAVMVAEISKGQIDHLLSGLTRTYTDTVVSIPGYTVVGENAEEFSYLLEGNDERPPEEVFFVLSEPLNENQLTLTLISDRDDLLYRVKSLIHAAFLMLFFCLVVSFGIAFYLITRNLKPVHTLVEELNIEIRDGTDELELINRRIETILGENSVLQRRNDSDFLHDMIHNPTHDHRDTIRKMNSYKTELSYTYFLMVSSMIGGERLPCADDDIFSYMDTMEKMHRDLSMVVLTHDHTISFLLNFEDEGLGEQLLSPIFTFLVEKTISRCLGVSRIVDNLSSISTLSYQAFHALAGKGEGIHQYTEHTPSRATINEQYLEWQNHLVHGRFHSAKGMIQRVIDPYLDETLYPIIYDSRRYAIINQMMETLNSCDAIDNESYATKLLTCRRKAELIRSCSEILETIAQRTDTDSSKHHNTIGPSVKRIIDTHITNPDLCLTFISEKLHVSNSYISKIFRREYGCGVVEYINTLRIEKAKEMLRHGHYTIKHIARSVGYSSDMNFIRVFKRYEHTTPGQFGS